MAWIYLAESEDLASHSENGCDQSPIVKTTDTLRLCSCHVCGRVSYIEDPSGIMCKRCNPLTYEEQSKFSSVDFLARISLVQEMESAWAESALDFSSTSQGLSKKSTRDSYFSKTSRQLELVALTVSAKHLPSSGMIVGGRLYQPPKLAPRTYAKDGSYLPTPLTSDATGRPQSMKRLQENPKARIQLREIAKHDLWPTPKAADSNPCGMNAMLKYNERTGRKTLITEVAKHHWPTPTTDCGVRQIGTKSNDDTIKGFTKRLPGITGFLNPTWVEWLMGYPAEWTVCADWVIPWFRSKRKSRSCASRESEVST